MNPLAIKALAGIGMLVLAFMGGYQVADWRFRAAAARQEAAQARSAFSDYSDMVKDRDRLAGLLAASNDTNLKALKEAQDENTRLRARDADRALRLRVAAACPTAAGPGAAVSAGVDSGTGAELDPTARQAYFALRDGIAVAQAQLSACQGELRARASVGGNKPRLPSVVAASPQE